MIEGIYRTTHPDLEGECVRVHQGGASQECFRTVVAYQAEGIEPPYDELPTREEYLSDRKARSDA